jgi:uncharacterized protein YbaP (TraB family)
VLADPGLRVAHQLARNRAGYTRIEQMLADGEKPFIAVGAGHLAGKDSVQEQLRKLGIKARRVWQ